MNALCMVQKIVIIRILSPPWLRMFYWKQKFRQICCSREELCLQLTPKVKYTVKL